MTFGDLRGWIDHLRTEGELHEISTEVNWDCELGTIARKAFGTGHGPALLFNNITDYQDGRCTRLFTGGLSSYSRDISRMFVGLFLVAVIGGIAVTLGDLVERKLIPWTTT